MPPLEERAAYFPRIDLRYESIFKPEVTEPYPVETLRRLFMTAERLPSQFPGESCVFVTHAAGIIALAAAFLKVPTRSVKPAAPCCLYCFDREAVGSPWKLSEQYNGSTAHLSTLGSTVAWPRIEEDVAKLSSHTILFLEAGDNAPWL